MRGPYQLFFSFGGIWKKQKQTKQNKTKTNKTKQKQKQKQTKQKQTKQKQTKQKQTKQIKTKTNKTKKPNIIIDESGIASTTQIAQVLRKSDSLWNAGHTSQITPEGFVACIIQTAALGYVAFPTSTIELMLTFEGNLL